MPNRSKYRFPGSRGAKLTLAVAVLAAIGLFLMSRPQEPRVSISLSVPVEPVELEEGLTVRRLSAAELELEILASQAAIGQLNRAGLKYPLGLKGLSPGAHGVEIDTARIALPAEVEIVRVQPIVVGVQIETEQIKKLPLSLVLSGSPRPGWIVSNTTLTPAWARVRGPASVIASVAALQTKALDIEGAGESLRREIVIDLPAGVHLLAPEKIVAHIQMVEEMVTRRLQKVPVAGKSAIQNYIISPPVIDITVRAEASVLDDLLKEGGMEVFVDLAGLATGVYVRRAAIRLPVGVTLMAADPEVFTVQIDPP